MSHLVVAAALQHVGKTHHIAVDVGQRVLQRITHPGLGPQVDHAVKLPGLEQLGHAGAVGQVHFHKAEVGVGGELGQAAFFERHRVIVVEVVQPHHLVAASQQPCRDRAPDKTGSTGQQDFRHDGSVVQGFGRVNRMVRVGEKRT